MAAIIYKINIGNKLFKNIPNKKYRADIFFANFSFIENHIPIKLNRPPTKTVIDKAIIVSRFSCFDKKINKIQVHMLIKVLITPIFNDIYTVLASLN